MKKSNDPRYLNPKRGYIPFRLRRGRSIYVEIGEDGWDPKARRKYSRRKANGLFLTADHNCDYVTEVPGLKFVLFDPMSRSKRLSDDRPFFALSSLDLLDLRYTSKRPVPDLVRVLSVDELVLGRRPGLEALCGHPTLRSLTIEIAPDVLDLSWLGLMPQLEEIVIAGAGQNLSVEQLTAQPLLRSITLRGITLSSLEWVSRLAGELLYLELMEVVSDIGAFDINPLGPVESLREVRISEPVFSLAPLQVPKNRPLMNCYVHEISLSDDLQSSPLDALHILHDEDDGDFTLYLDMASHIPGNAGIEASGHVPTGYFWQSLARYLVLSRAPQLDTYEPDSELDTMCLVARDRAVLEGVRDLLVPYMSKSGLVAALVAEAAANGFSLDVD